MRYGGAYDSQKKKKKKKRYGAYGSYKQKINGPQQMS